MARKINILNAIKVKNLNEPGQHHDGAGLYLEISPQGAKRWTYIFRFDKRRRQKGFGSFPAVSLAEARARRDEAERMIRDGIDPIQGAPPSAGEGSRTFGAVALRFIEGREAGWKNAKHKAQWRSTLETYAKPIWNTPVDQVGVTEICDILRPIWTKKAETAGRVRGRIEKVLDAARVQGLRSGESPAVWRGNLEHLLPTRPKGPKRHHAAMAFTQVPVFLSRLRAMAGIAPRALELLVHTATRTGEVLQARWAEFDLEAGIWTIPADRMKAGKVHRVPLTPQVLELLQSLRGHPTYVFPGQSNKKPLSQMSMLMTLRRMDADAVTVHGFRSSFRDWCGECTDFHREIAEQALAHEIGNEVERAYRRGDALEKRRRLMEQWSDYLSNVPEGAGQQA